MKKIKRFFKMVLGGEKYYEYHMNICNDMVTDFIVSTPFVSHKEAMKHKASLENNRSVSYICTISFRSRMPLDIHNGLAM